MTIYLNNYFFIYAKIQPACTKKKKKRVEYMCFSAEFQDGRKNCGKMICGKSGRIFIKITLFRTVIEINVFLHFT